MNITRLLFQLQELDLELESTGQTLNRIASQLGESDSVVTARNKRAAERQHLEELSRRQHSLEWEIDDLTDKLATIDEQLYSGRIRNPKELSNLQQEADLLKTKKHQMEDQALETMDRMEAITESITTMESELQELETEWQNQQKELSQQLEQLKTTIADLERKRQQLTATIDPQATEVYDELKKYKGTAVAEVIQGICHGCRISLPTTELQRIRSGSLIRCSSCGRILYWA